jgi:hypothetical protein
MLLNTNKNMLSQPLTVHERFTNVVNALGVKPPTLAVEIGMKSTRDSMKLYNIMKGKAKPSWATIEQLVSRYPEINVEYILRGIGGPLLSDPVLPVESLPDSRTVEVPFLPVKAYGSFINNYDPTSPGLTELTDTYPINSAHLEYKEDGKPRYKYLVVEVEGDSMAPQIRAGMKVLLREVEPNDWAYANGINAVLYDHSFIIKRIKRNNLSTIGTLQIIADATGEVMTIPATELHQLWLALRSVDGIFE